MLQRFDPRYFTVNFNTTAAASVVATAADALLVTCNFRSDADLIGLFWYSDDTYSHTRFRYASNYDYSTTTLDFDFVLTNIRALDAINGPTLTVTHLDTTQSFVRLSNYITSGTSTAGHVRLPFASVGAGFFGTDPMDWTNVQSIMLSIVNDTYVGGGGVALSPAQVGSIAMTNIVVTGPTLTQDWTPVAAHSLRMTDGYDDSYPLTPTRFVQQMYQLGYRDWYSIYMGISHHHDLVWNAGESRFVVNPSGSIINDATSAWFTSLLTELLANGFVNVVVSISFEIVDYLMPTGWQQYDADGNLGLSGWSPPSEFITPSNTTALNYLADVVTTVFGLFPGGLTKYVQIGEPWWWNNPFTTLEPCFYDAFTVAAYPAETGHAVPTPYLTSTTQSTAGYETFLNWLAQKLGDSTHHIIDRVRLSYPSAISALLFFTPQIFSTAMLQTVNLPISSWSSPQYDILQVEDYDWIIAGDFADHATSWVTARTTLGYPLANIHYLSGFNLLTSTADSIWPNVFTAILDGYQEGVSQVWVWARPEVFRDGIVWETGLVSGVAATGAVGSLGFAAIAGVAGTGAAGSLVFPAKISRGAGDKLRDEEGDSRARYLAWRDREWRKRQTQKPAVVAPPPAIVAAVATPLPTSHPIPIPFFSDPMAQWQQQMASAHPLMPAAPILSAAPPPRPTTSSPLTGLPSQLDALRQQMKVKL